MKKIINLIIMILMIAIGIGIAVAEAYYIIVKNGFGLNVLKYSLCGIVCFIALNIVCFILSLFMKEDNPDVDYEDSVRFRTKDLACILHIIAFITSAIIMVMYFVDGNTKVLGLILILLFTMIGPVFIRMISKAPIVEEKVVARIYNNRGDKIGEIRK